VKKRRSAPEDAVPKHQKFREIAEGRVNRAIDAILRIGKLSNRQLYEWEEAEIRKITKALRDAVSEIEARFESPKAKSGTRFKF
jgi:hypothetical protein